MSDYAIKFKDVWSKYRIKFIEDKKVVWEDIWALKDISFEIGQSETICILGENGSGKTTLLKLIAGLIKNEKGELDVRGSVSALLEIGAGFHPELTGRENIYLNASLFGLSKEQVEQRFDGIIEFAELGKFINAPVKSYSQGMFVRLGFSVAIHLDPEILLIDDSLAVGDIAFQRKCINKIEELQEAGKTLILVTHDISLAKRISKRGLLLSNGDLIKDCSISSVVTFYFKTLGPKKGIASFFKEGFSLIFNNGRVNIFFNEIPILGESGLSYSFKVSEKIFLPDSADWEIVKETDNTAICAVRQSSDLGLIEKWSIEQKYNDTILINIHIIVRDNLAITDFNLMLSLSELFNASYINDLTSKVLDGGYFIRLVHGNKIIFLNENEEDAQQLTFILKPLKFNGEFEAYLPKPKSTDNYVLSVSGMKKGNSRGVVNELVFSAEMSLMQNKKEFLEHLTKQKEDNRIQEEDCSVEVEEGKIRIAYKDSNVSRFSGLNNRFIYQDIEYEADRAHWDIIKLSDKKMECQLIWTDCPFSQRWLLELLDGNRFLVEMYFSLSKEVKIENISTEVFLAEVYTRWFTEKEKGDFYASDRVGDVIPVRLLYNKSRLLGVSSVKKEAPTLPTLILHNQIDRPILSTVCKLFKNSEEAVMFSLFNIPAVPLEDYKEGVHLFAKFELALRDGTEFNQILALNSGSKNADTIALNKEGINLIFDDGKGRLFLNDTELTKALGIFTSIRSSNIWYDSAQAQWKHIFSSADTLEMEGIWARLPLIQNWKFVFENKNSLLWEIKCRAYKHFSVEREQFGIMLTDGFLNWEVEKEAKGIFPNDFSSLYDIISNRMWSGRLGKHKKRILVSQSGLPSILVEFPFFKEDYWMLIENSDHIYSSRVIQAQRIYKSNMSDSEGQLTSFFQIRFLLET